MQQFHRRAPGMKVTDTKVGSASFGEMFETLSLNITRHWRYHPLSYDRRNQRLDSAEFPHAPSEFVSTWNLPYDAPEIHQE